MEIHQTVAGWVNHIQGRWFLLSTGRGWTHKETMHRRESEGMGKTDTTSVMMAEGDDECDDGERDSTVVVPHPLS
jgi:hypothetical protein